MPVLISTTIDCTNKPPISLLMLSVSGNKVDCTFENEMCGMSNIGGDHFDWTKKNGPTDSSNTGPSTDATTRSASGRCHDSILKTYV